MQKVKKRCGWCCEPLKKVELNQRYCKECLIEKAEAQAENDVVSADDYREQERGSNWK